MTKMLNKILLCPLDQHDRSHIIVPSLEDVVHRRNDENPTKHRRRPVPTTQSAHTPKPLKSRQILHAKAEMTYILSGATGRYSGQK